MDAQLDYKEHWVPKNWCFWTRVLEKILRTARRSNQAILKEISPEYSLEGLMLKLKLQYFGHLIWRGNSLEKILMLRKREDRRRRGWQKTRWLITSPYQWTWVWASFGIWWRTGKPGVLQSMGSQRVGYNWPIKQQKISRVSQFIYLSRSFFSRILPCLLLDFYGQCLVCVCVHFFNNHSEKFIKKCLQLSLR